MSAPNKLGVPVFIGYENQDWYIPPPSQRAPVGTEELTPEQTKETLNYFRKSLSLFAYRVCWFCRTCLERVLPCARRYLWAHVCPVFLLLF